MIAVGQRQVDDGVSPTAEIHDAQSEGLVQRNVGVRHSRDTGGITDGFLQHSAEDYPYVLDRVMQADVRVPVRRDREVHQPVP